MVKAMAKESRSCNGKVRCSRIIVACKQYWRLNVNSKVLCGWQSPAIFQARQIVYVLPERCTRLDVTANVPLIAPRPTSPAKQNTPFDALQ